MSPDTGICTTLQKCRGDRPNIDHLTSNCHSVGIIASKESKLSGCEYFVSFNMHACSNGSNSLSFRRNGGGPYYTHYFVI